MEDASWREFVGQGLDASDGVGHVVEDADAVDPIELAFQLIRVIDAEVAEGGVLRTGTTAAFGGGGQGLLTQSRCRSRLPLVQVGDVLGADPRAAACIQHPHGLGFGFGPGHRSCRPYPNTSASYSRGAARPESAPAGKDRCCRGWRRRR